MIGSDESAGASLYCTFWLHSHWFGVDARHVKEVTLTSHCTPIPHAPTGALGYLNLRGQIYLVIDIRQQLGIEARESTADSRLLILRPEVADCLAVVVDRIGPIAAVSAADLERLASDPSAAATEPAPNSLATAVARLEEGLLVILDPHRFLPSLQHAHTEPRTTTA
jgi:purine-binding chemotaxis protein CheW